MPKKINFLAKIDPVLKDRRAENGLVDIGIGLSLAVTTEPGFDTATSCVFCF